VPLRTLSDEGGPGLTEEEVRAYIEMNFIEVYDESSRTGARPRRTTTSRILAGKRARPQPDDQGARGLPRPLRPGLNQLFRGIGGPEYVASLLTHYTGSEREEFGAILYGNETFPGGYIAMAPPLWEDAVVYNDGTPATVEQMAQDVAAFLTWTAEPKLMARKQMGFTAVIMLGILSVLLYLTNKQIWAPVKARAKATRRPNNAPDPYETGKRAPLRGAFFFVVSARWSARMGNPHHPSQNQSRNTSGASSRSPATGRSSTTRPSSSNQTRSHSRSASRRSWRRHHVGQPPRLPQLRQKAQHLGPQPRVERRKRLIQQRHGPVLQQQPRQRRAPLLPARQIGRPPPAHAVQPHLIQRLRDPRVLIRRQPQVAPQGQTHILRHRQMRKQVAVLEQDRHGPLRRGQRVMSDPPT
jgi:ubiquinol-cytochrome c reductase cytochrome c1 subunit